MRCSSRDEGHDVGYVLGDMAADHFVEIIIGERISRTPRSWLHRRGRGLESMPIAPGDLVPATADVKNFIAAEEARLLSGLARSSFEVESMMQSERVARASCP